MMRYSKTFNQKESQQAKPVHVTSDIKLNIDFMNENSFLQEFFLGWFFDQDHC